MAYKIKEQSREHKSRELSFLIKKVDRKTKENYLKKVGLFKEEAIKEMSDTQLNELVVEAVKIKGY